MTEMTESGALETWSAASCPFTIEYSRRVLDDIRLAVVDAFFSLPRGGAEIGGVLLGRFADGRVTISEYAPLECDHIFGPSFTLSPGDHARLTEILSSGQNHMSDLQPVGWYHSHTRSDIFLSEADLDIQNRYFPEPWQVALVLRPSTFQPVQAGFFFREPDGSIHSRSSYQEFALDPLPVGQVLHGMPVAVPQPPHRQAEPEGPVITLVPEPVAAPVPEPVAISAASEPPPQAVAENFVVPAAEPTPAPRATLLPPALPPLPTLELVPEPGNLDEAVSEPVYSEAPQVMDMAPPPEVVEAPAVEAQEAPVAPELPAAVTFSAPAEAPAEPQPAIEPAPVAETKPLPAAEIKPAPQPQPKPELPASEPPSFLQMEPVRPRRRLWFVGAAAVILVLSAGGYQQRANWLPQLSGILPQRAAAPSAAPPPAPATLTLPLSANDEQGQLQIRWDSTEPAVTLARDGILQITDDGATTDIPLDAAHLQGGAFTYVRRGEHVDARLTVQEVDGRQVHTVTSFFGPLPVKPGAADPALRKQNSDLAKKNADLSRENGELAAKLDELNKQTSVKLKSDAAARAELGKQNADLTRQNAELVQQRDDLAKQTTKLKADLAARATSSGKQTADLARQNAELVQQRDDLTKQTAKLKADLAARPASGKPNAQLTKQNADVQQQRDDLLIQIAKLKAEMAGQAAAGKQAITPQQNAEFSKQRYALVNQVSQLESDLAVATARADRLARQLEDLRKGQTQRRLQNQSGEQ
jgi:hypothetical protein